MTNLLHIGAAAAAVLLSCHTALGDPGVFRNAGRGAGPDLAAPPGAHRSLVRRRIADLDSQAIHDAAHTGRPITIDLFDDAVFTTERGRRFRAPRQGDFNWQVNLRDQQGRPATMTLVYRDGRCAGSVIDSDGRLYQFHHTDDGWTRIEEVDASGLPPCATEENLHWIDGAPDRADAIATDTNGRRTRPAQAASVPTADVVILYTRAAREQAGGDQAIRLQLEQAVFDANVAYANSLAAIEIRAVVMLETDYPESGSFSTDLTRLRSPSDGYADEAIALRDTYGADFVSLITASANSCGIGYLMSSPSSSFQSYAFSVVSRYCLTNQSFAHELGHNAGCHHDRANAGSTPSYPYAYGYRTPDNAYRTVMAYTPGVRVRYFSNPDVDFQGFSMGVPTNRNDAAHNALTLTNNADIVAGWRSEQPLAIADFAASNETASGGVAITWTGSGPEGVEIYRDTVFDPNGGTRIAALPQGASSYFDDQATEGVVYTYWARAVERQGLGGFSAPDTGVAAPAGEPVPGDLNGDGRVDGEDLGSLLSVWGSGDLAADLTGDGVVDGNDLGALLGLWTG